MEPLGPFVGSRCSCGLDRAWEDLQLNQNRAEACVDMGKAQQNPLCSWEGARVHAVLWKFHQIPLWLLGRGRGLCDTMESSAEPLSTLGGSRGPRKPSKACLTPWEGEQSLCRPLHSPAGPTMDQEWEQGSALSHIKPSRVHWGSSGTGVTGQGGMASS